MNLSPILGFCSDFLRKNKFCITTLTVAGVSYVLLRKYFSGGVCRSKSRLDGKTVIITGANSGIGKETAKELARRGAKVILACRDVLKAERAAEQIRRETGNEDIIAKKLDLASLESVHSFCSHILQTRHKIDILINNAGIYNLEFWRSEEGFELQLAVNYLGPFLLTNLLLDKLKDSAPSRIINVSSLAYIKGELCLEDINSEKNFNSFKAYCNSKLCLMLFTRRLAKLLKDTDVSVFAVHPGVVKTELYRYLQYPTWIKFLYVPIVWLAFKTSKQGAQTSIHCAVSEAIEKESGSFYSDCHVQSISPPALDVDLAHELWQLSARMTNLNTIKRNLSVD